MVKRNWLLVKHNSEMSCEELHTFNVKQPKLLRKRICDKKLSKKYSSKKKSAALQIKKEKSFLRETCMFFGFDCPRF